MSSPPPPPEKRHEQEGKSSDSNQKISGFHLPVTNIAGLGGIYELEKAVYFDKLDDEQRGLISFADWLALVGNFFRDFIIYAAMLQVYLILSAEPLFKC